jgi:hypothetical protein
MHAHNCQQYIVVQTHAVFGIYILEHNLSIAVFYKEGGSGQWFLTFFAPGNAKSVHGLKFGIAHKRKAQLVANAHLEQIRRRIGRDSYHLKTRRLYFVSYGIQLDQLATTVGSPMAAIKDQYRRPFIQRGV